MRKTQLGFGLLLILIGLGSASSSNLSSQNQRLVQAGNNVLDKWEISCDFGKEERITLQLAWTVNWTELDVPPLPANISIVAPDNGETKFQVFFQLSPPQYLEQEQQLYASKIDLLNVDDDGLLVTSPVNQIGGITKQNGTYLARVSKDGLWWADKPPRTLVFLKEVTQKEYPYTSLLPIGVVSSVVGVGISIWGAKSTKKAKKPPTKRKSK